MAHIMSGHQYQQVKDQRASATSQAQDDFQTTPPASQWIPGFWRRLPFGAALSLPAIIITLILMISVLISSNNRPITEWPIQPSVYLAIGTAVTNILLAHALSQAATIAWWVKALSPGTTLRGLHNTWSHYTSLPSAIWTGVPSLSIVAFASIAVALVPINGILLQRASTVSVHTVTDPLSLNIPIGQEFPDGYTGIITGTSHSPAMTTSKFNGVVQNYMAKRDVNVTSSGCKGRCTGVIQGAGYSIKCTAGTQPFNLTAGYTNIFATTMVYDEGTRSEEGPEITFNSLYKQTDQCIGDLQTYNCILQPALMQYRVVMNNDTIALDPGYSYKDDQVVHLTPGYIQTADGPTTHGGMYLVLAALFNSTAYLQFANAGGYELVRLGGPASFQYANSVLDAGTISCRTTWSDPSDDILNAARELAFRTAITSANTSANTTNSTNIQALQNGYQEQTIPVYHSNYGYLGGAILFTLLALFLIIPVFRGWWLLGRNMSMSPLEIAKAFNAPCLVNSDSNASAQKLLSEIGETPVRYGAISLTSSTMYGYQGAGQNVPEKLLIADPMSVHEPHHGRIFVG
jgi:Protein of unknown function (DUF3176)